MVDPERLELPTPAFEAQCSIQLSYGSRLRCYFFRSGAPGEIRTPDLTVRSRSLYPAELRALKCAIGYIGDYNGKHFGKFLFASPNSSVTPSLLHQ